MTRIHRIYTEQALGPGQIVVLPEELNHYLSRVLRVTEGQPVVAFNGDGSDYAADVCRLDRGMLALRLNSRLPARSESPLRITLVQAVSRGERMDLTLQKATELGVFAVRPIFSARTEVRLEADKLERRMGHWRKVLISSCEQSGRATIPELLPAVSLTEWAHLETSAPRIVLAPDANRSLAAIQTDGNVELAVGPEGGFDEREMEILGHHGVVPVHIGPRILRTETAGPAAIAILQSIAGDLR